MSLFVPGLVAAALLAVAAGRAAAQSGLEIMQKQRDLLRVRDEQEVQSMKLVSKNGEVKERRIVRSTITDAGDLSKILIRFMSPRDVENTGLLIWEAKDGNDDQWLYLPATKKVKRIASSSKKNRFMGTDFAFEDLRPESLGLHRYTVVGHENVDGEECYVIEALPANARHAADSGYSKRRLWVRKDNHYTVRREYYDKKGKLEKVGTERKLVNVKGTVWRSGEIEMRDVQAGSRTLVTIQQRALDRNVTDSEFTEVALTREGP